MDQTMQFPGVTNAWTMPIKARIDMLTTGVRTPVGIKIFGADVKEIENIGTELEIDPRPRARHAQRLCRTGERAAISGLHAQAGGAGPLRPDDQGGRDGGQSAVGGEVISTTVEGRERYTINVRYARDFREDLTKLRRVLVPTMSGAQIPLARVGRHRVRLRPGHAPRRKRNALRLRVRGPGRPRRGQLRRRRQEGRQENLQLPTGYTLQWSGQYENMLRVRERLKIVFPSRCS